VRLLARLSDLRTAAFSPDSSQLAAGSWDGTIYFWDMKNLDAPPMRRHPNAGQIYDLAYGPEGRRLAYCARDGVRIWDLPTGYDLHDFSGHNGMTVSVAFSPDGTRLATGGVDGTVKIWDATFREEFRRYIEANALSYGSSYGPDGELLALGHVGGIVKIWNALTGKLIFSSPKQALPITTVAADRGGRWLAWISNGPALQAWDRAAEKIAWSASIEQGPVTGLAYNADGSRLAWGGADGIVHVLEADTGQHVASLGNTGSAITGVAFHPRQNLLATIDRIGTFRIWDTPAQKKIAEFGGISRHPPSGGTHDEATVDSPSPRVSRLAYSPDGRRLASATRMRPPEIWDVSTGKLALILDRAVDGAEWAAFSDDGQQFIAGLGSQMRIWSTTEQPRSERIRAAAERALAWHKREAIAARNERNWLRREFHTQYIIAAEPNVPSYRENYASTLAYLGKWDQAIAENNQAIQLGSRSINGWYNQVCLALHAEDQIGYQRACSGAHEKIELADNPDVANFLAWVGVIGPAGGGNPLRYVELAEQAVEKKPNSYAYLNTLGAALYRAGRYEDAISQLQRAIQVHEQKLGMAVDWAFLAMSYARLGDMENARLWLQRALDAPEMPEWWEAIEVKSLQREASELVGQTPETGKSPEP
jgi:WD40 repeat protein